MTARAAFPPGDAREDWAILRALSEALGKALPFDRYHGNESPDPLAPCAGYTQPSGPPLIVQFGLGTATPAIAATSLTRDGTPLEHCVYDGTTYTNPDAASQASGRSGLASRAAVVIIPKVVLTPGATYRMELTAGGQPLAWSFSVDCS